MDKKYNYEIQVPMYLLGEVGQLYDYANKIGYSEDFLYFGYNDNYGNVYVYSEDEQFTLFISEFNDGEINFCYTDYNDGEELILNEKELLEKINLKFIDGTIDKINEFFNKWQSEKDSK